MVFGVLFARKSYPIAKYVCVLMIVAGVALFLYKDKNAQHTHGSFEFGFGELLLVGDAHTTQPHVRAAAIVGDGWDNGRRTGPHATCASHGVTSCHVQHELVVIIISSHSTARHGRDV
jgi:hypothetical protein